MKRNARPSLFDAAVGFDDPLEMLLACHRRIERQLATLEKLRSHMDAHGVDAEASTAAQGVLRYFLKAAEDHHDDEEKDLFPLLEERIPAGAEKARFHALRGTLERDHAEVRGRWARLRKPLEAIADGMTRTLQATEVREFVDAYKRHIAAEEESLPELFDRWIDERDRAALGRSMRDRREMVGVRGFEPPASTSRT
ncbi:MAG: hemerythrin domain-containing protein [Burkholderiales bacterium]|nr:hemerythrin domain-containing protein [Burkholderiales bacterium]